MTVGVGWGSTVATIAFTQKSGKEKNRKRKIEQINLVLIIGTALARNTLVLLNSYCSLKHYCSALYHGY